MNLDKLHSGPYVLYRSEAKVKQCGEDARPRQRGGTLERSEDQRLLSLKNMRTLLRVTLLFWHYCYQADSSPSVVASVSTLSPTSPKVATSAFSPFPSLHATQLFQMINNTTSKHRDCSIQYKYNSCCQI